MKRDTWVPSKYQFLCSDHFTPDSLDIRWGIRYLKQTAIPTIFSLPEDSQEKDQVKNKPHKRKTEDERDICLMVKSEELPAQMEPKKNIISTEKFDESTNLLYSSSLSEPLQKHKPPISSMENPHNGTLTIDSLIPHVEKPKPVLETAVVQDIEVSSFHTSLENLLNTTAATLNVSNPEHVHLSVDPSNVVETSIDHLSNPEITDISVATQENTVLLSTITQTIEELNTDEESVITILVPAESSKPSTSSFMPTEQERIDVEDVDIEDSLYDDTDYGIEVLQTEHSYCRQDINRELLWQKVTKLHSKITLLELQEQQTLGRLKSLETLIGQLKQENLLSEEKLKIVENCFTTFEVTMIE
ncbi:THAP domain-containing protein 5 isoform X2 [Monodelphis domestica]|nr:THAP domain-containing protein 5 isoform X2 [Monodelphis domestica]XP_007504208.1 THAP domain-containing protein 5 isoform X2 [Monodelphis domestica]XP_056655528.1 THAP domain-containing protein 5 isoform X2 [Monodelphis domestica]XP_056655529.1 THAP domain-containing protein 5 isoform X2 [Monodelphis domestica]